MHRGAVLQQVMPLAMRNLAIAQERDKTRYRHVRSGNYDKSKVIFLLGQYVLVKQSKYNTLQSSVHPHILRILEIRDSGMIMLQGRCGATVTRHISQLAHCSVPVADQGGASCEEELRQPASQARLVIAHGGLGLLCTTVLAPIAFLGSILFGFPPRP